MFVPRKKQPHLQTSPGVISETVAGVGRQIDKLVAIVQNTGASHSDRITAAEMIRSFIEFQNLSSISEIWYATQTLLDDSNSSNVRKAGWRLTLSCIGKDELNNSSVIAYYTKIVSNANFEDFSVCLECLKNLTKDGRRVIGTQTPESLSQFLLKWIEKMAVKCQDLRAKNAASELIQEYEESFHAVLEFTGQCLKFNMYMWEPSEIEILLLQVIAIIRITSDIKDCRLCCELIETVMAYGLVPATVLQPLLEVICGIMSNIQILNAQCKHLLTMFSSGHLRLSTFVRLCRIVDTPNAEITLGMRCSAASELVELIIKSDKAIQQEKSEPSSSVNSSRAPSLISERFTPLQPSTSSFELPPAIDVTLPVSEMLDCFISTLNDISTPLKLVVNILEGMIMLTTRFELMRRICAGPFLLPGLPSELINMLMNCYQRFEQMENCDASLMDQFTRGITVLASAIAQSITEKLVVVSPFEQLFACIRISKFLTEEACNSLFEALQECQFCTPGIDGWLDRTQEVVDTLYVQHDSILRNKIIDSVSNSYHINSNDDGFVTDVELTKLTTKLYSVLPTASQQTVSKLAELYKTTIFFCSAPIFESVTKAFINHAVRPDTPTSLAACDALISTFFQAFKLYKPQATCLWHAILGVCDESINNSEVFGKCYAIVCRVRVDNRNRMLFVNGTTEPTYGTQILEMQSSEPSGIPLSEPSLVLKFGTQPDSTDGIEFSDVLNLILKVLKTSTNERVISLVLLTTAAQLATYKLFETSERCLPLLADLRDLLLSMVSSGGQSLPLNSTNLSIRQSWLCIAVHILTVLMPYQPLFPKASSDKLMNSLILAIGQHNLPSGWAVHCCTVACYEAPSSVQRFLPQILSRLQLKITSRDSSMFILDFLLSISLEGSLTFNFTEQDYKRVFGMCFSYIQNANDSLTTKVKAKPEISSQWQLRLAHSAITNLFLSMDLANRRSLVPYLVRSLILSDHDPETVDPLSLVLYDMLNRFTYSDVPLRVHLDSKQVNGPEWEVRRWLRGVVVIELQVNKLTGEAIRVIRRPAGMFTTVMKAADQDKQVLNDMIADGSEVDEVGKFYSANYYLLCGQLGLATFQNSATEKPPSAVVPLSIPIDSQSSRAIQSLDRVPVVDFYKVGIVYIAPNQRTESEILSNVTGSAAYREFLQNIGVQIKLKHNRTYYAGGLDTEQDLDGPYAIAWSSKISQIIFHTITMMPTTEDQTFASKKRHIGNNFVNIYFDESGIDFEFDIVKSQFNFINIVITPTNSANYYKVRAYRKSGMMNTLAAYETKVVNARNLPLFVRNLCLKTSQYAAIHNLGGEYMDNWLYRLQIIQTLRDRVIANQKKVGDNANDDDDEQEDINLLEWMDFTKYTN